jgi:TnpA family transposase
LEKASRTLARAAKVLFEELELVEEHSADLDVAALLAALEEVAPRAAMMTAAFAEYGRIAKAEHLLRVVDGTYRRQMNRQLTVQESCHKLARDVCHGKRGTIHQAYRDGVEDQLGSLGLVLNAIVLWTTRYIDAAVKSRAPVGELMPGCLICLTKP